MAKNEGKWIVLGRKLVAKGRFIDVYQDAIKAPSGAVIEDYLVLKQRKYVKVVALDGKGRVALIREYRHTAKKYVWDIPGGMIDKGESVIDSARRELAEETGYTAGKFTYKGCLTDVRVLGFVSGHVVRAENVGRHGAKKLDEFELISRAEFVAPERLRRMIKRGEISNSVTISSLAIGGALF